MDRLYRVEVAGRFTRVIERRGEWNELTGDPFGSYQCGDAIDPNSMRILPPVVPSKIVAVGLNYRDHAKEMGKELPDEPLIFLKPSTAVIGTDESIVIPTGAGRVDHEAELDGVACVVDATACVGGCWWLAVSS